MIYVFLFLILLHILCCIFTYFGIKSGVLNVHNHMFFVVLFLPIWGFLTVIILHFQVAFKADDSLEIPVPKMVLESEIFKSVTIEENNNSKTIVPLEEALLINSARERRQLIMDVLNDNPKEYIEFLQKAGDNDDTEVVHYAVTAMVEISKENDFMLQELERKYSANPDDYEVLTEFCDFLWNCLEQNLMQGQVEIVNRIHFGELTEKKLKIKENISDYIRLVKNNMKLKNYTQAGAVIGEMDKLFPGSEELLLLKLEYYASVNMGQEIIKLLEETEKNNVYLSAKAKEAIAFWRD